MKKKLGLVITAILLVGIALAVIPATRDEIQWQWTSFLDDSQSYKTYLESWPAGRHAAEAERLYDERSWSETTSVDTLESYARYLQMHPEGEHVAGARENIESLRWEQAASAGTTESFEHYLRMHPEGEHVAEARENIESLHWERATSANTFRSLQGYIDLYPDGRFVQQARVIQAEVLSDDTPFLLAQQLGTEAAFREFLADFPGHRRQADARSALGDLEGRDIVDLLSENRIEIETEGSGIEQVRVNVRRLVNHPVTIRIPVGTFFVARNSSSQNMVTTAEIRHTLRTDEWAHLSPSAACTNRSRNIPGSNDSFTIRRSPHQDELATLITALDETGVPYAVRQAAIWIVTDDADYEDLGSLVERYSWQLYGGTRLIREYEAARAMQLCEEAGIDITRRAIWRDRSQILQGLEDDNSLRGWLEQER